MYKSAYIHVDLLSQLVPSIVKVVTYRQPIVLLVSVPRVSLETRVNPRLTNVKALHARMDSAQIQIGPFNVYVFLDSQGICVR